MKDVIENTFLDLPLMRRAIVYGIALYDEKYELLKVIDPLIKEDRDEFLKAAELIKDICTLSGGEIGIRAASSR
jgi:hypothetical protein